MNRFTRAQEKLMEFLRKEGNAQILADIQNGRLRFEDFSFYARFSIEGHTGRYTYIDSSVSKEIGLVSIDKGKLPEGEVACIEKVAIKSVSAVASLTDPAKVKTYSSDIQTWDAALRNGEFVLTQSGGELIRLANIMLGAGADSEWVTGTTDAKTLSEPQILEDRKQIELAVDYAKDETVTSSSGTAFIEFLMFGVKLKYRSRG